MHQAFIFFDGTSRRQVEQVKKWQRENDYVDLIATDLPENHEDKMALKAELGQPIGFINKLISKRFKLKAVPAIVTQEDLMVRVKIKKVD